MVGRVVCKGLSILLDHYVLLGLNSVHFEPIYEPCIILIPVPVSKYSYLQEGWCPRQSNTTEIWRSSRGNLSPLSVATWFITQPPVCNSGGTD